jgi:hypothetical protein
VGKHLAADGASAHPIVAAALASRPAEAGGAHSADGARTPGGSPVGWPGTPEPGDGRTGWPADADGEAEADAGTEGPDGAAVEPAGPVVRQGWRRLFGAGRVA